ncbi:hypothetical protein ACQRCY_08335, partial [Acidaminococcus fermentans]|uniref:hypothetical protein n=1 Tax=Acidaminococcus fermentans TaxID=905 RepID=UPI003D056C32
MSSSRFFQTNHIVFIKGYYIISVPSGEQKKRCEKTAFTPPVNCQRPKEASKAGFEQRQPLYKSFP